MEDKMTCKTFQNDLPNLVLTPNARPSAAAAAHLRTCPPCAAEYLSFQSTFAALDSWHVPEPSAYFDQKLAVRLREEQASPKMSWLENLQTRLLFNTGRSFRPLAVGALALALVAGGGGVFFNYPSPQPAPQTSAAVNDLQILDRNETAFQQLDELQQDEDNSPQNAEPVQSNGAGDPVVQPAS